MIRLKLHWQRLHHYISDCVLCFTVYQRNLHLNLWIYKFRRFCFFALKKIKTSFFIYFNLHWKKWNMTGECSSCVSRAKSSMWPLILLIAAVTERETCRSAPWLNLSKRGKGMKTCCVASFKGVRSKKKKKSIEPNLNIISQNKVVSTLHDTCTVIDKISIKY